MIYNLFFFKLNTKNIKIILFTFKFYEELL